MNRFKKFCCKIFEWMKFNTCRNEKQNNLDLILFFGLPGTRKTSIFRKIIGYYYLQLKDFERASLDENQNLQVIDSPSLDFSNLDSREEFIQSFNIFLNQQKQLYNKVMCIAIFVKFERIDIMKKSIYESLKYLQNFQNQILIVVTDFQYSEDEDQDKKLVFESLKHLLPKNNQQALLFLKSTDSSGQIKIQFLNGYYSLEEKNEFGTQGTIFYQMSQQESQAMQYNLSRQINIS